MPETDNNIHYACRALVDGKNDIVFECRQGETVLDAAERAGWALPYSCLKGVCMTCEGVLLSGQVSTRGGQTISGYQDNVRFCISTPITDIEIKPVSISIYAVKPERKILNTTIYRVLQPARDIYIVELRLPIGVRVKFKAGQYLKIYLDNGISRSYSMANPPHKNQEIQLHIRYIPGGEFSEYFRENINKGSTIRIELPYGNFSINGLSELPAILVATGTGFAPMKSIIEDLIQRNIKRTLSLYWGASRPEDMYLMSLAAAWADKYPWFTFIPVISEPDNNWKGRTGFVHNAVLEDYASLANYEIYACGNMNMISAAKNDFIGKANLSPENFHCDIFVPTGD